jgi:hypothetical protein
MLLVFSAFTPFAHSEYNIADDVVEIDDGFI